MAVIKDEPSTSAPRLGVHGVYMRTVLLDPDDSAPHEYVARAREQIQTEGVKCFPAPESVRDTIQEDRSKRIAVTFKVWTPA